MGIDIALERKQRGNAVIGANMTISSVNCRICGTEKSMAPALVHRFEAGMRFLGQLLVIPSVMVCLLAVAVITQVVLAWIGGDSSRFAPISPWWIIAGAVSLAATALVGGTLGYFLLSRKNVFHCRSCGHIVNRA